MDLHDKLEVKHEWTTPIGKMNIYLPEITRQVLIKLMTKQSIIFTEDTYNETNKTTSELKKFEDRVYNLFDYSNDALTPIEVSALKEFEKIASKIIRTYINKAWDVDEDVEIRVRGFGNVQKPFGRRTAPHFHHGWDGVFVHYLTAGEEFSDPNDPTPPPLLLDTDYSGNLLLLDPRPAIRMPHNNKAKTYIPETGMTLIHPGYLWHETHTHTKAGIRVAFVLNFNIHNKNYDVLPTNIAIYNHENPSVLI